MLAFLADPVHDFALVVDVLAEFRIVEGLVIARERRIGFQKQEWLLQEPE